MSGRLVTPSSARRVVLDGFLPVPRGSVPGPVVLPAWPVKDPGDVLDYELDVSAALLDSSGDAIATVAVSATPAGQLMVTQTAAMGAVGVVWLAGGLPGTTYTVQVVITTAGGRTLARAVELPVRALTAAPGGSAPTLITQAGVVVTDQGGAPILVAG